MKKIIDKIISIVKVCSVFVIKYAISAFNFVKLVGRKCKAAYIAFKDTK